MDFAIIFDIYPTYISAIMHEVLTYWIIKPNIGKMNIKKYLGDKEAMDRVNKRIFKKI